MSDSTLVVWDDVFTTYDFGPTHPLRPLRLELTMALAGQLGVLNRAGVTVRAPHVAGDDLLEMVHDPLYVASVRRAPDDVLGRLSLRWGLGTGDNPVFPRMHEASALVTGASVDAARAVWEGTSQHAVNLSGGLHHAMRDRASGFCIYDDPAVAIAWLLQAGATKVAYVDVDVHHGDGVEAAFWDDPRVLTVSMHESGRTLFPGTGWAEDVGGDAAAGSNVNVALPMGTGDAEWLRAFDAVVPPVLRAFRPQVLVTQHGCDTHALDPLAHLLMSVDGQRAAYAALHGLAHELCGGKWVVLGGGGYEPVQVVPRAWTHLLAEVTGASVEGVTPDDWRDLASRRGGEFAPTHLSDDKPATFTPWEGGSGDPADGVDRAVAETRAHVFPLLGLDPDAAQG
ncbi:MAG: acetoin utilization protein AcuC [Actinomycetota bacterium]|jgi:acetoin utilization protein AcuC|nr:acetoin utilization protein AcuC [Actinomycetota bacterium]